jgi:hypothetical protein
VGEGGDSEGHVLRDKKKKLFEWGRVGIVRDMCYEIRRAETCADYSTALNIEVDPQRRCFESLAAASPTLLFKL